MPTGIYERTEFHRKRLSESHIGVMKGAKFSEEHKCNLSKAIRNRPKQTEETRAKRAKALIGNKNGLGWRPTMEQKEKWAKSHRKLKVTSIEAKVEEELKKLGIKFEAQYSIKDNEKLYIADIFIPSLKLIIECNGDYWHSLEDRMIRDDELQDFILERTEYDLLFLWEHVIKSKYFCLKDILGEAGYLGNYLEDIV